MDKLRECGCKGRRSCLWCEQHYHILPDFFLSEEKRSNSYVYCSQCNLAWPGWSDSIPNEHPNHSGNSMAFPGIFINEDFLTDNEANTLLNGMDGEDWDVSQSGRRKQNYGPKCNFKKKKISVGNFNGFPKFSLFVQNKFNKVPLLKDYFVIEQCSLEYDPVKGAAIDPHIDDCWIWGERIITVNVLGDSVLTLTPYMGDEKRYNLDLVPEYQQQLIDSASRFKDVVVRIPMPAKSLLIIYGQARYLWEHFVLREDVKVRRACLAYREFTPPYLPGGAFEDAGKDTLNISKQCLASVIE